MKCGSRFGGNHEVNEIKISEFENRRKQKLKLKLAKITIQNQNLKLYEERLG